MRDHIAYVLRVHGVEDRVEVGSVGIAVFGVLVLQVSHHGGVVFELGEDMLDSELIILWHSHKFTFAHFKEFLLTLEHLAQKIAIYGR